MHTMTEDEYKQFLTEPTRTAKVATLRANGAPHVTPVWFALDGDTIVFSIYEQSAKTKHLRHDPRLSLCVDDEKPPFSYVSIEGTATLGDDPAELLRCAMTIGGKYLGADRAEEYGKSTGVPGTLIVRFTPTKIIALADLGGV